MKSKVLKIWTILLLILAGTGTAHAHVLNLDYSAFTLSKILCNRDYLVPEVDCADWRGAVALDADFSGPQVWKLKPFMQNTVHGEGTSAKFKTIGWHYLLGVALPTDGVEIGWEHHSRHALDQAPPHVFDAEWCTLLENKFPVYDAIFVRFTFTGKRR